MLVIVYWFMEVISERQSMENEKDFRVLNIGQDYPDQLLTVFINDTAKNNVPQSS
jgi:hypothetical protein